MRRMRVSGVLALSMAIAFAGPPAGPAKPGAERLPAEGRSCANKPEDVNRDGLRDLVCHFTNDPSLFQSSDTEGILRGQTLDSPPILIQGSDRVTPVP